MSNLSAVLHRYTNDVSLRGLIDLAAFAKVVPATALSWLTDGLTPKGETLIRLQHFLLNSGYELEEATDVPEPAFKLAQMIAFDIIGVDDAVNRLNYTNATALYRVIQGSGLTADRASTLGKLVKEHETEVQSRIERFRRSGLRIAPPSEEQRELPTVEVSSALANGLHSAMDMCENLLDIAELQPGGIEVLVTSSRVRVKAASLADRLLSFI